MYEIILNFLATAPDSQLQVSLTAVVAKFIAKPYTDEEAVKFLGELRDWTVHLGGASSFALKAINVSIGEARVSNPPTFPFDEWAAQWT